MSGKSIEYAPNLTIKGPWLVDSSELSELVEALSQEIDKLRVELEKVIEEEARSELSTWPAVYDGTEGEKLDKAIARVRSRHGFSIDAKVKVEFSGGRNATFDSLTDWIDDPDLLHEHVKSIEIDIYALGNSITCKIGGAYGELNCYSYASGNSAIQRIFIVVKRWAQKYEPPIHWRVHSFLKSFSVPIFFVTILVSLLSVSVIDLGEKNLLRADARKLLEGGISTEELPEGVEIILRFSANEYKTENTFVVPDWTKTFFFFTAAYLLALQVRPKFIFGIGAANRKLRIWKAWLNFVILSLPLFLFVSLLWPRVQTVLGI